MGAQADDLGAEWNDPTPVDLSNGTREFTRSDLQQLMWDAAGLSRNATDLTDAAAELATWAAPEVTDQKSAEDANLLVVAKAVVASALAREESRGGHFRADFPETDPAGATHSSVVAR
jgi:L-aspartate oxidase